ncbi:riboflavin synthase subunit alpha [Buchnera aphidicola]|uniref:riboflavin synthase subunit alpha n=1 Tax=Buchnera aphidicola TaxID=9 RepID=UPI0034649237
MFTGIVNSCATVCSIEESSNFLTYGIKFPIFLLHKLKIGASVANNGCCLTVKYIKNNIIFFDIVQATLDCTNLGLLLVGNQINIERSAKFGDEIGGHIISGHIIATAIIENIYISKKNREIWLFIKKISIMKYILYKGFIAIDGVSLTVGKVVNNTFCVYLIPETVLLTTLGNKKIGDVVNIEVDYYTKLLIDNAEKILLR